MPEDWATGIPSRTYWMAVAIAAAGVALFWRLLTYGGYVTPIFLPSPTDVWKAATELCLSGVFAADFGRSCESVSGGFVAGDRPKRSCGCGCCRP
jgi:NitT/TauT family transport system permease protein